MHIVFVTRITDDMIYKGNTPEVVGVKIDSEKGTKYFGSVHLRLEVGNNADRTGTIMRDKWGIWPHGTTMKNPTFNTLLSEVSQIEGGEQEEEEELEDTLKRDASLFVSDAGGQKSDVTAESKVKIEEGRKIMFNAFGERGKEAFDALVEDRVCPIEEMSDAQLAGLLVDMRNVHAKLKEEGEQQETAAKKTTSTKTAKKTAAKKTVKKTSTKTAKKTTKKTSGPKAIQDHFAAWEDGNIPYDVDEEHPVNEILEKIDQGRVKFWEQFGERGKTVFNTMVSISKPLADQNEDEMKGFYLGMRDKYAELLAEGEKKGGESDDSDDDFEDVSSAPRQPSEVSGDDNEDLDFG